MKSSEIPEEFTDWEEVQFPFNDQPSSPFPQTHNLDPEMEISEQEDLPFQPEENRASPENAPSPVSFQDSETDPLLPFQPEEDRASPENASPLSFQGSETEPPHQQRMKSDSKLSVVMSEVKTVICAMGRKIVTVLGSSLRCPTFVPVAALAVVMLACMKMVQRWKRLLLLIREKDQRIGQLLHQIAVLNESFSARRRVRVLRIN